MDILQDATSVVNSHEGGMIHDDIIKRQQADALLRHHEAQTRLNHVRLRVQKIGAWIKELGVKLEEKPEGVLPEFELKVYRPSQEISGFVDLDAILALVNKLDEAETALSNSAENAARLGVPVPDTRNADEKSE